jgi:hypothetical protein
MKELPVRNGAGEIVALALVSDCDYERCLPYNWTFHSAGYVRAIVDGKDTLLHRFIIPDGEDIDHINRNKLDNTRENLRAVSHAKNLLNTGAKGYWKRKDTKKETWQAYVYVNGKKKSKSFNTEEEAKEWRNEQLKNYI